MYLTKKKILLIINRAPVMKGASIDWDEPGRAIIYLAENMTWDPQDGNRTIEGFIYDEYLADEPRDTVGYLKERIAEVQPITRGTV